MTNQLDGYGVLHAIVFASDNFRQDIFVGKYRYMCKGR